MNVKDHPIRPFSDIAQSFADQSVPFPIRGGFLKALQLWRKAYKIDQHERVIEEDFSRGNDGFFHADWVFKELFLPQVSCSFLADTKREDPLVRASKLIHATTLFYLKAKKGEWEQEVLGSTPQDMSRYPLFFQRPMISKRHPLRHTLEPQRESSHVAVWLEGRPVLVRVLENGKPIEAAVLYKGLRAAATELSSWPGVPIGLVTALANDEHLELAKDFLLKNQKPLETCQTTLFTVAIDLEAKPQGLNEAHTKFHSGCYENRDWRAALSVVINGHGEFALVVNPYAGVGGTLSARLTSDLALSVKEPMPCSEGECEWSFVSFAGGLEKSVADRLREAIEKRLYPSDQPTSFKIEGIGAEEFREKGFKKDAAFHAALNLSYFKSVGKVPSVGNFINLRSVRHGDIWRYGASTPEMAAFVKNPKVATYRAAERAHGELIKEHKRAEDPFYLAAMTLKRLISERQLPFHSFISLMMICQAFVPRFNKKYMNPHLWVSQIPSYEGMLTAGRAGSYLGYLDRDSRGGHYMIHPHAIMLCLVGGRQGLYLGEEESFAELLKESLFEVLSL